MWAVAQGSTRVTKSRAVTVAMMLLLAVACSRTTSAPDQLTQTTSSVNPGMQTFTDAAAHFSIDVPANWTQVAVDDPVAMANLKKVMDQNPDLANVVGDTSSLAERGVKFVAVGVLDKSNVIVGMQLERGISYPPTESDWQDYYNGQSSYYASMGVTVVSHGVVHDPTDPNGVTHYEVNLTVKVGSLGPRSVTQETYVSPAATYVGSAALGGDI